MLKKKSAQTRQPKGMYVIALTETFERLSYRSMSFLLILFASYPVSQGGLGLSGAQALNLVGTYVFCIWTLPLIGGFIADRFIGLFPSIWIGSLLIILGHLCMLRASAQHLTAFYTALCLVCAGTCLFKPSMPALLGRLYTPNDLRRGSGFSWYYIGINIGTTMAGFSSGLLFMYFGFRVALASAAIGMTIGLICFIVGTKWIKKDYLQIEQTVKDQECDSQSQIITKTHKKALYGLCVSLGFFFVWATVFNIGLDSGVVSFYIENYTQRTINTYEIPTTFFQSLEAIFIVLLVPVFLLFLNFLQKQGRPLHLYGQMLLGLAANTITLAYFVHLTFAIGDGPVQGHPFHYMQFILFLLGIAIGEVMMAPSLMSCISLLAPKRWSVLWQALYTLCLGISGKVAAMIGAASLLHPHHIFAVTTGISFGFTLLFIFLLPWLIKSAQGAVAEWSEKKIDPVS